MLKAQGLQDPEPVAQLSLFPEPFEPCLDRPTRLRQAYQQQGEKSAYVEKDNG